jgi:hypothetical protein
MTNNSGHYIPFPVIPRSKQRAISFDCEILFCNQEL